MSKTVLAWMQRIGRILLAMGSALIFATYDGSIKGMVPCVIATLCAVLAPFLDIVDMQALEGSTISVPVLATSSTAFSAAFWSLYLYNKYGNLMGRQRYVLVVGMGVAALAMVPYVRRKVIKNNASNEEKKPTEQYGDLEEYRYPNVFFQVVSIVCLGYGLTGSVEYHEVWIVLSVLLILVAQLISGLVMRNHKAIQRLGIRDVNDPS